MTQVNIKRVYDPQEKDDGFRIFVDRLWPRGIRKENLHYDLWAKDIAPASQLRQWFHSDTDGHWQEFKQRYIRQLEQSPAIDKFLDMIKAHEKVTLLYGARNTAENQALILKEFIESKLK